MQWPRKTDWQPTSIHHLKMALELTVEHEPTPAAIGRAYNNLGTAYQALNELQTAQEYYDLALAQAIYGNDTAGQARVYGNIGNFKMLLKQYDRIPARLLLTLSFFVTGTASIVVGSHFSHFVFGGIESFCVVGN